MRIITLTIALVLIHIVGFGQTITYQPLHGSYTHYLYRAQVWNGSGVDESFSKTIWSGDTVINGLTYFKTYQNGIYHGGIREDVGLSLRVFLEPGGFERDISIDHFLQAGDYLTDSSVFLNAFRTYFDAGFANNNYDTLYVEQVDSVLEDNGTYSATYYLRRLPYPVGFVYNTYRGLQNFTQLEYNVNQECYREDGEQTIPGQETPWSYMCDLALEEKGEWMLTAVPNPVTNEFRLIGQQMDLITEVCLYDVHGKRIRAIELSEIHSQISLSGLDDGIYILSINNGEQVLQIVKN